MEELLSPDELAVITLKSPFVYEYGDAPYFKSAINEFPLHFFVRYRANKDDPTQHSWSRLLEVIDRRPSSASPAPTAHTADPTGTANTNTTATATAEAAAGPAALRWKEKYFFVSLRVEGEERSVELPRLSSALPDRAEVAAYCARRAALSSPLPSSLSPPSPPSPPSSLLPLPPRSALPGAAEICRMRAFREQRIARHRWTRDELDASRAQHERLSQSAAGAGSAPIALTVTALRNRRLETALGIASSRHATGHSARAMERRPAERLRLQNAGEAEIRTGDTKEIMGTRAGTVAMTPGMSPAVSPAPIGLPRAARESPDASQAFSLWNSAASLAEGGESTAAGGTQKSQTPISQETMQLWEESRQDAERFFAYVSEEKRSAYITKIADITLKNYERNKRDRLQGIENEKRLERKGNLLESGGLWIMDDQLRAQLARKYRVEQDIETAGDNDKTKTAGKLSGNGATNLTDTAETPGREEDAMVARFLEHRRSQELVFTDVPDDFLDVSTQADTLNDSKEEETERSRVLSAARSPELLVMGRSPRHVMAQLLHHAASSAAKRSSQREEVLGDEPPLKATR